MLIGKPLPHQERAIEILKENHYCINGDEQGLGKTFDSIAIAVNEPFTLVVCPAFLKYNWAEDIKKFTSGISTHIIETKKDIEKSISANVAIVNYEKLSACRELFSKATLVIADEAHYLKNLEAERTRLFHEYIKEFRPARLHLLSGTAIKNRVPEIYSLLLLMSYSEQPVKKKITDRYRTAYGFSRHFSNEVVRAIRVRGREVTIRKFEGLNNEEELKSYMRECYFRRLTKDVMYLPELNNKIVQVSMIKENNLLEGAFKEAMEKGLTPAMSSLKAESALYKAKHTIDYAKNLLSEVGTPIVIFSDHVASATEIAEKLPNSCLITGATPMTKRHEYVTKFQNKELNFFVATIGAASTGITLTAANDLIFNDLSWVPADNSQAKKRIHRIGQNNACRIHFISGSVIDRRIITELTTKMETISKIL